MQSFVSDERMNNSSQANSTNMLTAMDFEKLYEKFDECFQLNTEHDESLCKNNFGTIGGERKKRNPIQSQDSFDNMLDDDMLKGLLDNATVEDSSPQQSKFLSMIKRNNSKEISIEQSEVESLNGFTFNMERLNASSPSLTYLPNCESDTKSMMNDIQLDTNSLAYVSGIPGSWLMEEELSEGVELVGIEEELFEDEIKNNNIEYDNILENSTTCCPFTKMIQKHAPKHAVELIEAAVKTLMVEVDPTTITIPHFQELVIKKLEEDIDAVYISDEEEEEEDAEQEEVEECLICTELLEKDLQSLEPCHHIFHQVCIKQWLGKETSCPKCRAIVIQLE